jgi:hypothetical protein
LILAALAADAAPGKNFRNFRRISDNPDLEILELWDDQDNPYTLTIPASIAGVAEQAQLMQGLRAIAKVQDELPFEIPSIVGSSSDGEGNTAVVMTMVAGPSTGSFEVCPRGLLADFCLRHGSHSQARSGSS